MRARPLLMVSIGIVAILAVVAALLVRNVNVTQQSVTREAAGTQVAPIESVGPIPLRTGATGAFAPQFPPSVITGAGVARSPNPILKPPGNNASTIDLRVYDVSAGGQPGQDSPIWRARTSSGEKRVELSDGGGLTNGRVYSWQWSDASTEGTANWSEVELFNVDLNSGTNEAAANHGGISVDMITGQASLTWAAPQLTSPVEPIGVGLNWKPTNANAVGLPRGWQLTLATGSDWKYVLESAAQEDIAAATTQGSNSLTGPRTAPAAVTIGRWDGSAITMERNRSGVYVKRSGLGDNITKAETISLVMAGSGADRSWSVTDISGVVTRFAGKLTDGRYPIREVSKPGVQYSTLDWESNGRPTVLTDGLSRKWTFTYAGSGGGGCASSDWTRSGFAAPPAGMLCQLGYPAGDRSDVGYAPTPTGAQIALIKDPGNTGATIGWDSVGRLAGLRSSLVNRSASAEPSAKSLVSSVEYNSDGQARRIEASPAEVGGSAMVQQYQIPEITKKMAEGGQNVDAIVTSSVEYPSGRLRAVPTVTGFGHSYTFDARTWNVSKSVNRADLAVTKKSDEIGRVTKVTDPTGRKTEYTYDERGRQVGQSGGVESGIGLTTKSTFDSNPNGEVWTGLSVTKWPNADWSGDDAQPDVWNNESRALAMDFNESPFGSGEWSASATGIFDPNLSKQTDYRFNVESGGGYVGVFIDGNLCGDGSSSGSQTCVAALSKGPHQIRVQLALTENGGRGFFSVKAGRVGEGVTEIPAREVTPGLNLNTKTTLNDVYRGSQSDEGGRTEYEIPANGQATANVTTGGQRSTQTYESFKSGESLWGRELVATSPGGKTTSNKYWGNDEAASPPGPCDGSKTAQGGGLRQVTRQDGTVLASWYDSHSNIVASRLTAPGGSFETTCRRYDDAGVLIGSALYDNAGKLIESSNIEAVVDGKAWISRTTVTHGPANPVSPGKTVTSTTELNLAGQPVSYTDESGTRTDSVYDSEGRSTSRTITPTKGDPLKLGYSYLAKSGFPAEITANGVRIADLSYDSTGQVQLVKYPNSTSQNFRYAANGSIRSTSVSAGVAQYTDSRTLNEAGRTMSSQLVVTGPGALTERREYSYDSDQRLVATKITVAGKGSTEVGYGFGRQDSRCAQGYSAGADSLRTAGTRDGRDYYTCHDDRGRTIKTTDPALTGGSGEATISHDSFGRVTRVGGKQPVEMTWAGGNQIASIKSGAGDDQVTTSYDTYAGRTVGKQVGTAAAKTDVTYAYSDASPTANPIMVLSSADRSVLARNLQLPGGAWITQPSEGTATLSVPGVAGGELAVFPVPALTLKAAVTATATTKPATETPSASKSNAATPQPRGSELPDASPAATSASATAGGAGDSASAPAEKVERKGAAEPTTKRPAPAAAQPAPEFGLVARTDPYGQPLAIPSPSVAGAEPVYGWQALAGHEQVAGPVQITILGARPYFAALGEFVAPEPQTGAGNNLYGYTGGDPINTSDPTGNSTFLSWLESGLMLVSFVAMFLGPVGMIVSAVASGVLLASSLIQMAVQEEDTTSGQWIDVGVTAIFTALQIGGALKAMKTAKTAAAAAGRASFTATAGSLSLRSSSEIRSASFVAAEFQSSGSVRGGILRSGSFSGGSMGGSRSQSVAVDSGAGFFERLSSGSGRNRFSMPGNE